MSINNCCFSSSFSNNDSNITSQRNFLKKKKIDISLLHNKLNNIKKSNKNNIKYQTNSSNIYKNIALKRNINTKNESISLNDISSLNKFSQDNIEIKPKYKKNKKVISPDPNKYSNAVLFKNRISKHIKLSSRNKSGQDKDKMILGNNLNSSGNDMLNNKNELINKYKYNLKNQFLTPPRKRLYIYNFDSYKKLNKNQSYYINNNLLSAHPNTKKEKDPNIFLTRVNSAFILPKINTINIDKNSSFSSINTKKKDKNLINQNLKKFLLKIKKKFLPKKRILLSSYKLPSIIKNNKNLVNMPNSCIHKLEYGNSIIFVKTHLDGLDEEKKRKEKKTKSMKKYEINEGYVDLNVLNSGNNISFKTNLILKDGLYFYEFNKYGRMETVEEKVHKIKKDKKEFKKLLERYSKNEVFKSLENQDFEFKIKRNYGADPIINKNIYRDLYHMLFKNKQL